MRKVSTSLSLLASANLAAVFSLACTGADNSSGPPQTLFPAASSTTPIGTFIPPVQPVASTSPTTNPNTTSAAPTTTAPTSAATTSAAPTTSGATLAPTSTATQTSTVPGNTSINNPLDDTSDDEETTEDDEETSVGNPDGDPGIPIDEDGWFPSNSNVKGFQGSWYCFADTVNETTCVDGEPPWVEAETGMCLTGKTTVRTEEEGYDNWGAGIGASLNDQDGDKENYDAETKDIKGFKFTITGDLGDAVLKFKVPRTTKDGDSPPEVVATVGQNSVDFDDLEPPEWDEFTPSDLDLAELTELKWQIVGGEVESDYSFCITNVEPL